MATILRVGQAVAGYTIQGEPHRGGMAISYPATSPSGEKVFFKQYKSPSVTVPWYKAYVDYQKEIKRRIEKSDAARFCYRFVDFFEAKAGSRCYFQVFEFVENGGSLAKVLEKTRAGKSPLTWEQRLIFARVMLAGVSKLHKAGVVHADLKPENIQMIRDDSVKAGFNLKVIDMDYSVLADKKAPWDGHQGYVGSPNYMSPEHLGSPPPTGASDVFTCALMLYELLAQGNPYADGDQEVYFRRASAGDPPEPVFQGPVANGSELVDVLVNSLCPDPKKRPSAEGLLKVLQGVGKLTEAGVPDASSRTAPDPGARRTGTSLPSPTRVPPPLESALRLVGSDGKDLCVGIRTSVGKHLLSRFGDDAKYSDDVQFVLERDAAGWFVSPVPTKNETLLNGKAVKERTAVSDGDVLAVGREAKGVVKLPLTVRFA